MPRRFTRARQMVPCFRSSRPDRSTGRRAPCLPPRAAGSIDHRLMARANALAAQRRHPELVTALYAGCDRAPLNWEQHHG